MSDRWLRFQLWALVIGLCGFGLVMIASTTGTMGGRDAGVTHGYILKQGLAMGLGLLAALVISVIGADRWRDGRLVAVTVAVAVGALIAVLIVGRSVNGARRWIDLGPLNLQPAELAKFALVIAAAWHFGRAAEKVRSYFHGVLLPLAGFAAVAGLVYGTKDLGTVMVLGVILCAVVIYAEAPWLYLMTIGLAMAPAAMYVTVFSEAYRRDRILAFLDPMVYDGPAAFHLRQSFIAIGSGGLFGVGLGESSTRMSSLHLPERHTDFIYAVVCEEFGLVGAVLLALAFLWLVLTGLMIAARAATLHQRLLAVGATMALGLQAFWNMLVVTGAVPTKGLTLPFISYGGSSVLVCLALIGVLDAVARANAAAPVRAASTTTRIGARIRTERALQWRTEQP